MTKPIDSYSYSDIESLNLDGKSDRIGHNKY